MEERFHDTRLLSPDALRALSEREDRPGLIRAAGHGALMVAAVALLVGTASTLAWWVGAFAFGCLLATSFGAFHEALHYTAFRTRWLNEALAWVTGIAGMSSPTSYRAFHFAHHRATHVPGKDPELVITSATWAQGVGRWLLDLSGLVLLLGKVFALVGLSLWAPASVWDAQLPWIPARDRSRVSWESRLVLAVWVAAFAGAHAIGAVPSLILALLVAHVGLAIVVTAEHTGLATEGPIPERTRTTDTWPIVRWLFWNLPRHAEHHAWPSIPFFRLDEVHAKVVSELPHAQGGYIGMHLGVLRGIFGR